MTRQHRMVALAVATAVAVSLLTVGLARAGSAAHSVHACVAKHGGALRVDKTCTKKETSLTFSADAVRGKPGKAGAPGNAAATLSYVGGTTTASTAPSATVGRWVLTGTCTSTGDGLEADLYVAQKASAKGSSTGQSYIQYTEGEIHPDPQQTPFTRAVTITKSPSIVADASGATFFTRETITLSLATAGGKVATFEGTIVADNSSAKPSCALTGTGTVTS